MAYEDLLAYAVAVKAKLIAQFGVDQTNLPRLHFVDNRKRPSLRNRTGLYLVAIRLNAADQHVLDRSLTVTYGLTSDPRLATEPFHGGAVIEKTVEMLRQKSNSPKIGML